MHAQLIEHNYSCPYCGEHIETLIDTSQGSLHTIEDCSVCCRPIELHIELDASSQQINLTAHTDTE
ncbi:MAG: CPXCG motif-containing cysteine-rich protein [Cycloclasticus sp.]|nr:restriction endonuclease [Cycloclasticus sp. 46_83_sub15_T18]OUR84256.1 restriction endonuclease [Cycloclasticus sp. 46_120_T64]